MSESVTLHKAVKACKGKHCSLLDLIVSYKVKICENGPIDDCIQIVTSFSSWAQYARVLQQSRLERLVSDQHSSLLGPFVWYKE
jgi:hypothetical protein